MAAAPAVFSAMGPVGISAGGAGDQYVPPTDQPTGGNQGGGVVAPSLPKILVVDDEEAVRRTMLRTLRRAFPQLVPDNLIDTFNVVSGIQVFDVEPSIIQAVFTDVRMPGGFGTEIYHHVRKYSDRIPVVFSSGGMPDNVKDELERILATDPRTKFYAKPDLPGREIVPWLRGIWGTPSPL